MHQDKDYKIIIKEFINLMKNKEYDKTINNLYDNLDDIISIFNNFLSTLIQTMQTNQVTYLFDNYSEDKLLESINKFNKTNANNKDLEIYINIIRYIILNLIEVNKYIQNKENVTITIANNNNKLKLFALYILIFNLESKTSKKYYHASLDFEFDASKIALMQVCFNNYIFIVNPKEFNKQVRKIVIKYLMKSKSIYKILHGADSLDIPYLYK